MRCEERAKLLELILAAAKTHSEAVTAMLGCDGEALKCARKLATDAEATYQDCRAVLEAHERDHGCGIESTETPTEIEEKHRRGFEPDRGPQQSFHLSRSLDAASHAQSVRKFMGWMQHRRGLERLGLVQEGGFL